MLKAAACGAVMARAKRESGLDLDADLPDAHGIPIMRAMHHETPGGDRLQPFQRGSDPILCGDGFKNQRLRRLIG